MGLKAYRFVGLNRDVWLPDDIEVEIDIIPDWMIGWVRSGSPNNPDYSTWHDTGTSGSTARSQRNYLHNGPQAWVNGRLVRRQVGFNFAVDDHRIIQLTPLDEDTWAAGTAVGNDAAWHIEQCFGGNINFERSMRNAAALHGGLIAAMPGWVLEPSLVQHNHWSGKDCPGQIRRRGLWPQAVKQAQGFFDQARLAIAGGDVGEQIPEVPEPVDGWPYPDPVPPPFWDTLMADGATHVEDGETDWYRINSMYRVKAETDRLQYAIKGGQVVGPRLMTGFTFRAAAIGQSGMDGRSYVITPMLTRVALEDLEYVNEEQIEAIVGAVKSAVEKAT